MDLGGSPKAYPFSILQDQPVVNDVVAGHSSLVFFDESTGTALVYDRTVAGRPLTFRLEIGQFAHHSRCYNAVCGTGDCTSMSPGIIDTGSWTILTAGILA